MRFLRCQIPSMPVLSAGYLYIKAYLCSMLSLYVFHKRI